MVEGRPLRGWRGRVQLARARLGHSHLTDQTAMRLARPLRRALADHWRLQGELEHSSVVAYQDQARRLALLDAPEALVRGSLVAAQQEGDHWVRCFELAGRYLGRSMGPGRLRRPLRLPRSRQAELCSLAAEALRDGVLLETYASHIATARADRATDPRVIDALRLMARDEAAHAELERDVLEWCLAEGGDAVRDAVRDAAFDLPSRFVTVDVPDGLDATVLGDHGMFDSDASHEVFSSLVDEVRDTYLVRTQV